MRCKIRKIVTEAVVASIFMLDSAGLGIPV